MIIDGDAKQIAVAFIKARADMNDTVVKDAKGNYGKYATLAALVEATSSALAKHDLAIVQEVGTNAEGVTVDTWLIHASGTTMHLGSLTMPCDRKPQSVGSAITYGRRYALAAVCGLAPEDDDGQAAQNSVQQARQVAQKANAATEDVEFSHAPKKAADEAQGSPPHQRLFGQLSSGFGPDADKVRPWLIQKWTAKFTPDNTRNSATELSDTEKDMLADYVKENLAVLQDIWKKRKAAMLQATEA